MGGPITLTWVRATQAHTPGKKASSHTFKVWVLYLTFTHTESQVWCSPAIPALRKLRWEVPGESEATPGHGALIEHHDQKQLGEERFYFT